MRSATKRKTGKDPAYLAWLHDQPCCVCGLVGIQRGRTEAAHVGERGLSQKSPDRTAIPLCGSHHREGRLSLHKLGKKFWDRWGLDREALIAIYNANYESERAA